MMIQCFGPDFNDPIIMVLMMSEGGQTGLQMVADELGCRVVKADDGCIIGLESDEELTEAQVQRGQEIIHEQITAYVETK
jgi:hypothetical protein